MSCSHRSWRRVPSWGGWASKRFLCFARHWTADKCSHCFRRCGVQATLYSPLCTSNGPFMRQWWSKSLAFCASTNVLSASRDIVRGTFHCILKDSDGFQLLQKLSGCGDVSTDSRRTGREELPRQGHPAERRTSKHPPFGILNLSGSSVSTHRLLASNQTALRPRHRSPPSESTTLPCRTRPRKQPREAATLGWEYRSQQVRRRRVSGAQGER